MTEPRPSQRDRALRYVMVRFGIVGGMPLGAWGYAQGGWLWVVIGMAFAFLVSVVALVVEVYKVEVRRA